jgi:serine/threonine protein kinase
MEFIEGVKFDDDAGLARYGVDFQEVANRGVRAFIKQVLEDGFFHGDTHPGNILVRPDGEIVYLDFGMVDTMPPDTQAILVDAFVHLVNEDMEGFLDDMVRLGFLPEGIDRQRLLPLVDRIYRSQLGLDSDPLSMQEIFQMLGDQLLDLPFCMPDRFTFLMRSVGCMEMVVRQRVPIYRFLEVGIPYAAKLMLSPERAGLRDQLWAQVESGMDIDLERWKTMLQQASREPSFDPTELREQLASESGIRWTVEALLRIPLDELTPEKLAEGEHWLGTLPETDQVWSLEWLLSLLEYLVQAHPTRVASFVSWGTRWLDSPTIRSQVQAWTRDSRAAIPDLLDRAWKVSKTILSDPRIDLEPFVQALVRALSPTGLNVVDLLTRPGLSRAFRAVPPGVLGSGLAEWTRFIWSIEGRTARRRLTQAALGSWRHWLAPGH